MQFEDLGFFPSGPGLSDLGVTYALAPGFTPPKGPAGASSPVGAKIQQAGVAVQTAQLKAQAQAALSPQALLRIQQISPKAAPRVVTAASMAPDAVVAKVQGGPQESPPEGMSLGYKIGLGVGAVAVLGGLWWWTRKPAVALSGLLGLLGSHDRDRSGRRYVVGKVLANIMLEWHGGQGSAVYSVGSSALAGYPVAEEVLERAIVELEQSQAWQKDKTRRGSQLYDRRLPMVIKQLQAKLRVGPIDEDLDGLGRRFGRGRRG